jgi:nicotinate-nucleotide adenylyltransferase
MKDFIFTIVHDDIYLLETPTYAIEKYGEDLKYLHHENGMNFYFTLNRAEDLLWINLIHLTLHSDVDEKEFLLGLESIWPYFDRNTEAEEIYPLDRLTFFGGSFNPWHEGHSTCVRRVLKKSNILVLPDKNPFKKNMVVENPFEHYIELAAKLKSELNLGLKWIYPGFILKENGNPTAHWVEALRVKYSQLEIFLAMGFDSVEKIDTWIDSEVLIKTISGIYILSRNESESERIKVIDMLVSKNPDIEIEFLGHHQFEGTSSTIIREQK